MPGWDWALPIVIALALVLDFLLGEPRRAHPLVAFGNLAGFLERHFNRGTFNRGVWRIAKGGACWLALIVPVVLIVAYVDRQSASWGWLAYIDDIVLLYLAIGWRSMVQHIEPIEAALTGPALTGPGAVDLPRARAALAMIVSRDTENLDEQAVLGATVETTLENSADALFASLFWYALAGPVGVVAHRLANTLDAMWGYRNSRFNEFGRCAARMDDILNLLPAQLLAFTFAAISGRVAAVVNCITNQGWHWKSPNAGAVMAAGAAALGLVLGGPASYHGQATTRPSLGQGRAVVRGDLMRVRRLVQRALLVWLVVLAAPPLLSNLISTGLF